MDHPLAGLLAEVAAGRPPPPDGTVTVLPSLGPGLDDAVVGLDGHLVVVADVPAEEVRRRLPDGAHDLWCHPAVTLWLAERTGRDPGTADIALVAPPSTGPPPLPLVADEPPPTRVHRTDVSAWRTEDGTGRVAIGRGLAGRWEVSFAVEAAARGAGVGRALARAARHLVPAGEALWAQTAPGNVRSVRALLAAGFTPVAGETLLLADRPPAPIPAAGGLALRPLRQADVEAHRALDDEATRLGFGFPRHATAVEVHLAVAGWRQPADDRVELGVWRADELVGHVAVWCLPDGAPGDVGLSYATVPHQRRRGVAVAAARAALDHAVATWGARRAVIEVLPANTASRAVAHRLGAVEAGEHDGHVVHHLDLRSGGTR
ncbi:MAG TPA: GNAT family N-acetyltransferase [Iamia sp.]|nr:GNAT family N-acetyltransferase [Iamia sp.]